MFLRVPKHSKTLSTGPIPKLSPRYCGPFRVLKRVGNVAYKLKLLEQYKVHPVFHVSSLHKRLHDRDNVVDTGVLVEYIKPPVEPHEPKRILDHHELCTRNHIRKQVLVKWKDVMTRVRLVHGGIRFRCTGEPDRQSRGARP